MKTTVKLRKFTKEDMLKKVDLSLAQIKNGEGVPARVVRKKIRARYGL